MKANAPLWIVSLGQGGGDAAAVGGPGPVNILNPDGGSVITFEAGEEGAAGPTLAYGATIEPEGPTVTVEVDDPAVGGEVVLDGWEPFTDYVVTIYGVNVAGRGKAASTNPFQLNFNLIEESPQSGTFLVTQEMVDADGSADDPGAFTTVGEEWVWHRWTPGSTSMTVTQSPRKFHVAVVAGGGGGGTDGASATNGAGGGGGVAYAYLDLQNQEYSMTVANGGARGGRGQGSRFWDNINKTLDLVTAGGGNGGRWQGGAGSNCSTDGTFDYAITAAGGGGGSGGDNDNSGGQSGNVNPSGGDINITGYGGGRGEYGGPGGGGSGKARGQDGSNRYDPQGCSKGDGGRGWRLRLMGNMKEYGRGGRGSASAPWSNGPYGCGNGGGCGGNGGGGQAGAVIIAYKTADASAGRKRQAAMISAIRKQAETDAFALGVEAGKEARSLETVMAEPETAAAEAEPKPKRTRKKAD